MNINLRSSENNDVNFRIEIIDNLDTNMELMFMYKDTTYFRINKFLLNLPAFKDEMIWGGGEQYTYLNLREGQNYPIWVNIIYCY